MSSKIPSINDIYTFSYAYTLGFFAIVTKVTDKTVFFGVLYDDVLSSHGNGLDHTETLQPLVYNGCYDKFSARKTSFDSKGNVSCSYHNSYGKLWDGKSVTRTRYY